MSGLKKKIRDFVYRFRPLPDYYGRDFKRIYAFLKESRNWSRDRIQEYKLERLRALIKHAQTNVPYYRDLFKQHGIMADAIKTFEDFSKIPALTKQMLRDNLEKLKADNLESFDPLWTQTSGTTSAMTALHRSRYHEAFRKAAVWRFFQEYGFDFKRKRLSLSCRSFDINSPVADLDRVENNMILNTYHIIAGNYEKAYQAIKNFRPHMIWTHPSPLSILAEYALEKGYPPVEVPLIAVYSEVFYPHLRNILEKAFPTRFIEYYGNRENSIGAWGNADGKFYEISEYCHLEVVGEKAAPGSPRMGDVISTSLHNYATPLIRYHSEDLAQWHGYLNPDIPYPVVELIGGRGKDVLLARDGFTIPFFLAYIDKMNFKKLKKYQMEQVSLDEIILRVVPKEDYVRERDEKLLLEYASGAIANRFKIRLEYVDDIPLTENGKYRSVISRIAVENLYKR
jgi:phenylacetate-CoA ligase